jgi:hypothetical protein
MHARSLPAAFAIAAALALAACGSGADGTNERTPAPTGGGADALPAAREMLRATNFAQQVPAIAEQMSRVMLTQIIAQGRARGRPLTPAQEAELRRIVGEEMRTTMTQASATIVEDAAQVYARYFTADELRELQRIQTTPVMLKMQRVAPQFSAELAQVGMAAAARRQPEMQRRVSEAMARLRAGEGN